MTIGKMKGFVIKYKWSIGIGCGIVFVLLGGVIMLGMNGQSKTVSQKNTASTTTTQVLSTQSQTTKSSSEVLQESKVESLLALEVSADTNVAEIEKELNAVHNQQDKARLAQKLAQVKEQVANKQQEQANTQQHQAVHVQVTQRQDETSQTIQQTTSAPIDTQATQAQTFVQTTQAPVTTTLQTTPETTQKYRINNLGNSGMEFATMEEAEEWADVEQLKVKKAYWVLPVIYSDDSVTYTVDWY